ncbi:imidazole glycerol phosphate synthase subunit HisH [Bdellovibrio sp. HCB288]|uniref:imidazole glycerol phosphate synthase subunit HisH n=1 Tax=Bdellovibrio sp. HCB288 TaxID=3394355 RepID=UPI0039B62401
MISIVNYGMGNIGSIVNMLKKISVPVEVVSTPEEIFKAKKILLPGVGAFDAAMTKINESGIRSVLNEKALIEKVPVLGICLGMQLLTNNSDEGQLPGLAWVNASTLSFRKAIDTNLFKVPHMGWNEARLCQSSKLTSGFSEQDEVRFYFVHSYYVKCMNDKNSILKTEYGIEFDSGIQNDNIFGAQFHPEKSHKYGMKLLENFARI